MRLLVSVRSAAEARSALQGGAAVIDVKEPDRGPLGRADASVWAEVTRAVAGAVPVSVALGELHEWNAESVPHPATFAGVSFRKLGLAGSGPDWSDRWTELRCALGPGPSWVAVLYADWERAEAPCPDDVLDVALAIDDCSGVLIDTWDKARRSRVDDSWRPWLARARAGGRFLALAGGLDESAIHRLSPLAPDLFAVRGAACDRDDRNGAIDPDRVSRLVRAARSAFSQ